MRRRAKPWWLDLALLAGALAICGLPLLLWPDRSQGTQRLVTAGILAAAFFGWAVWMRGRRATAAYGPAPWERWLGRAGSRGRVRRIAGRVGTGWQVLTGLVWFGLMAAATPEAIRRWADGDSSQAGIVVVVGAVTLAMVVVAVAMVAGRATTDRRIGRELAERAEADGPPAPLVQRAGISAPPPATRSRAADPITPSASPPALHGTQERREQRAVRMLAALGATPVQLEQAKAARRAKLLERERRRQQRDAAQRHASVDRERANRALGRD